MAGRLIVYDEKTGVVKDPVHLSLEILKAIDQLDERVLDLEAKNAASPILRAAVLMAGVFESIRRLFSEWRERRATSKRYKEFDAGFDYALGVLREETDPELHRQIEEQAASDPENPFCFGMRIAINGWRK